MDDTNKIIFYAAECMEFPSFGEFYKTSSLEEAVKAYNKIPTERMNAVKGIGFILLDGSIYADSEWGLLVGEEIDYDGIEMIDHYKNSPLVQDAVKRLESMKEKKMLLF